MRIGGTNIFDRGKVEELMKGFGDGTPKGLPAVYKLLDLNSGRGPKAVHLRLKEYREASEVLIQGYVLMSEALTAANREIAQLKGAEATQSRKRWTPEEDEVLIEQAADGNSLIQLALDFNRSPQAISSRITYLVGIQKMSREVAGHIIGFLDGEPVDGHFEGQVTK